MKTIIPIIAVCAIASPAAAEVKTQGDNGFSIVHMAEVPATPEELWKRLIEPKDWWSKTHSWSGSAAGFSVDPRAGGCFCEALQEKQADGKMKTVGSVEHMRVIFASPGKVLRMQGALGPLQSEAVLGTFTVAMEPSKSGTGTKVSFSYVVGGYMRYKPADIATAVDKVIAEQFTRMIKPFEKAAAAADDKKADWSLNLDGLDDDVAPDDKADDDKATSPTASKPAAPKSSAPEPQGAKPAPTKPKTAIPGATSKPAAKPKKPPVVDPKVER